MPRVPLNLMSEYTESCKIFCHGFRTFPDDFRTPNFVFWSKNVSSLFRIFRNSKFCILVFLWFIDRFNRFVISRSGFHKIGKYQAMLVAQVVQESYWLGKRDQRGAIWLESSPKNDFNTKKNDFQIWWFMQPARSELKLPVSANRVLANIIAWKSV